MPGSINSTQTMYGGRTSSKPGHYYSTHPSTARAGGSQATRDYRLSTFTSAPSSTFLASSRSAQEIEAAHRARAAAQIQALAARLP